MEMKRAKIVCTIGPSSSDEKALSSMIAEGMDVARLNFSHGTYEDHKASFYLIRKCAKRRKKPVAILQDLQGIKIRLGLVANDEVSLREGSNVILRSGNGISNRSCLYIRYAGLERDLRKGHRVLIDDGLIMLKVQEKGKGAIRARVIEGGVIRSRKGVNLPDTKVSTPSFTAKDRKDLAFGIALGVDYVAVSFVRTAGDVVKVQRYLKKAKRRIPVIAKIEKPEALKNIESILDVAEGIMIARGDLGVEMQPEEVPVIQKELIGLANRAGKIVITATQMLDSMTVHLRPTRAEATDVANAVIDGSDALMLSGETSAGKYPVRAVRMMRKIIERTEKEVAFQKILTRREIMMSEHPYAVADAAVGAARDIRARAIVAFTDSGYTARLTSKFRPTMPLIAFATSADVQRNLSIMWGVEPHFMKPLRDTDQMVAEVERYLVREKLVKKGDSIVIIASLPMSVAGKTNFMKLHTIH